MTYFILGNNYKNALGTFVIVMQAWQGIYVTKYLKILYRTNKDFNKLSIITTVVSIVSFISIYLIYIYGFYGLCVRAIVIVVVDFYVTSLWRPLKVKMKWDSEVFRAILKIGFPIFAVNFLYGKWSILQRTMIWMLLGIKSLGLFTVVFIILGAYNTFSTSISSVLYPSLMVSWGEGKSTGEIFRHNIVKPMILVGSISLLITPLLWILLPSLINSFAPNYTEIIYASQWITIAGLLGVFNFLNVFYNVINFQKQRFVMYLSGILCWALLVLVYFYMDRLTYEIFPIAMVLGNIIMIAFTIHFLKLNWNESKISVINS